MNKKEEIKAMMRGQKVTHQNFTASEWMTMNCGQIELEDGVICDPHVFWFDRNDDGWSEGYSIWNDGKGEQF
jgi:hypothetical protein